MLLACTTCHRQYDVGSYPAGARVRCLCGTLNTVPEPRERAVEMLHCSNCGGRLESGARICAYCSAEVRLADRGLGPACPECFATTLAGARHCSSCGVRLDPQGVIRALLDRPCPRCRKALTECESDGSRYVECTTCGGLWLDEAVFERMAREKDRTLVPAIRGAVEATAPPAREQDIRYLPCPVCGELMNRRNFAGCSGVILDWCRGHGWWFDAAELERVMSFLERGGMVRSRRLEHERELNEARREKAWRDRTTIPPFPVPRRTRRTLLEHLVDALLDLG